MKARAKRAKKSRPLLAAKEPAKSEAPRPFVNVVALDNSVPGGFRYVPVPCPQPERS